MKMVLMQISRLPTKMKLPSEILTENSSGIGLSASKRLFQNVGRWPWCIEQSTERVAVPQMEASLLQFLIIDPVLMAE